MAFKNFCIMHGNVCIIKERIEADLAFNRYTNTGL